jgi:hypothetical protein
MPRGVKRKPTKDRTMSVEYLLVVYKQDRDVLADGDRVGVTNHTILLAPSPSAAMAMRRQARMWFLPARQSCDRKSSSLPSTSLGKSA